MPFSIVRQDITKMKVDCIVNAANTALQMGGGVCGAIFQAAGADDLRAACEPLAPIQTGDAVVTPGFRLPAKFIIHTAGPVYHGGGKNEEAQLRACYLNSLRRAVEHRCESVVFPLISSGIYGYPKDKALAVATTAIREFLKDHDLDVTLALFDKDSFSTGKKLMGEVESYINEHYVEVRRDKYRDRRQNDIKMLEFQIFESASHGSDRLGTPKKRLDEVIENLDEPFSTTLLRLIDAKGKTDVQVYKKANIDRKLFSKIRTGKDYTPTKRTALALAIALELSLQETEDLLARAGYVLSHSRLFDTIVEFFIGSGRYDIYEINEVLFQYDQPILGG